MDLIDVYRVFFPATAQYIFFSEVHGTFSKIDHILGHKASLNQYKKIEILPCILSDNKTRTQQQKKQQKINKQLEAEKHVAQCSVGHRRNKGGNKKYSRI
jgi:hypothetical protein